jgi:hypothetical protein
MSWYLDYKKYKKLVKQLVYHRTELEYQEIVLKEVHSEFNAYYVKYCAENGIDLAKFNKENSKNIEKEYKHLDKEQEVDEGVIVANNKTKEEKEGMKEFAKVYKMIAKKIHPDVLAQRLQTEETLEKEEMFKIATRSYHDCDWGVFVEIAEDLKVQPSNSKKLCKHIKREIEVIKKKVKYNSSMYSWKFHECEDNKECKDLLIKSFLKRLSK